MASEDYAKQPEARTSTRFATTHWSTVLRAVDGSSPAAREAMEKLCRAYWYPLYAFVRRNGRQPHDAEDLVQAFLARLLATDGLRGVERGHGRFRYYLLAALRHFLANEWDRAQAEKRGGGKTLLSLDQLQPETRYSQDLADTATPDTLYERAWAATILERVHARLREEYERKERPGQFALLEPYLLGAGGGLTYAEVGAELGLAEGSVKAEVHRLRKRYRSLLRAEIAHTVASPAEISDELNYLITVVSR